MADHLLLRPGPVPVAPAVARAMDAPMLSRRSPEFGAIFDSVREDLGYVFERSTPDGSRTATDGVSLVLTGTATLGMEAAVADLARGGEVVAAVNGAFGERFADIAACYADVTRVESDPGAPLDLDALGAAVSGSTDLVTAVHNETSTGVRNPVGAAGEIADENGARFAVDGVSSVGGDEFRVDDWNVDVAVTDPQKALAAPPGISALYLADSAIDAVDAGGPPYYASLERYLAAAEERATPFTAAGPLFRAFAVALDAVREEGMPDRIERHRRRARAVREGVRAMGLDLFPDPAADLSNTLTAVAMPDCDPGAFDAALAERDVSVGGGIGPLDGRLFRVGNMGHLSVGDFARGLRAVGEACAEAGAECDPAAGVEALRSALTRG